MKGPKPPHTPQTRTRSHPPKLQTQPQQKYAAYQKPREHHRHQKINIKKNQAIIRGVDKFVAAPLISSDLRGSIALVLAAMSAEGTTSVDRIYHLDRGAENFEKKLKIILRNVN